MNAFLIIVCLNSQGLDKRLLSEEVDRLRLILPCKKNIPGFAIHNHTDKDFNDLEELV